MKKLLAGLLLVGSSLSFAQEFRSITIKNLTYPDQKMTIECLDAECSLAMLDDIKVFKLSTLEQTIENRRGYRTEQHLYSLTDQTIKNIKRNKDEAYYGKAVGNTVLAGGTLVVDTVIAVPQLIIKVLTPKKDSIKDRNAAKRLSANLEGDIKEVILKEKYYREIKDYLGSYSVSQDVEETEEPGDQLFRCQLAEIGCYHDGGRYGVMVKAADEASAIKKCEKAAVKREHLFCQLTPVE